MKKILCCVSVCLFALGAFAQSELDQPMQAGAKLPGLPGTVIIKVKKEDAQKINENNIVSVCHSEAVINPKDESIKEKVAKNESCFTEVKAQTAEGAGEVQGQRDGVSALSTQELDRYDSASSWYFYYYTYNYQYRPCYYYGGQRYVYRYAYSVTPYSYGQYSYYYYYYYNYRW